VRLLGYLGLGVYFGLVLAKSEVISWFRIQEMFRFDSFHMYGVLGSGVLVAMLSLWLLRKLGRLAPRDGDEGTAAGAPCALEPKEKTSGLVRNWADGTIFGLGWALVGACPGPLYILIGHGVTVYVVGLLAALVGAWTYGRLRERLPH